LGESHAGDGERRQRLLSPIYLLPIVDWQLKIGNHQHLILIRSGS